MPTPTLPRTKIVCTLGPASATREVIRDLMEAGLDVARINFSHGTHEQHARTIALVREVATEIGRPVAVLGDLQGPRIRIGDLPAPLQLVQGEDVVLCIEDQAGEGDVPVTYDLAQDVHAGDRILVNDGLIELVAIDVHPPRVTTRVVHGGAMGSHKGMNLPGVHVLREVVRHGDVALARLVLDAEHDVLSLLELQRRRQVADPDARPLQVAEDRDGAAHLLGDLAHERDGLRVPLVRAVREVDARDVEPRLHEIPDDFAGRRGGAERADDLRPRYLSSCHVWWLVCGRGV